MYLNNGYCSCKMLQNVPAQCLLLFLQMSFEQQLMHLEMLLSFFFSISPTICTILKYVTATIYSTQNYYTKCSSKYCFQLSLPLRLRAPLMLMSELTRFTQQSTVVMTTHQQIRDLLETLNPNLIKKPRSAILMLLGFTQQLVFVTSLVL
jgi:hypothetical protein